MASSPQPASRQWLAQRTKGQPTANHAYSSHHIIFALSCRIPRICMFVQAFSDTQSGPSGLARISACIGSLDRQVSGVPASLGPNLLVSLFAALRSLRSRVRKEVDLFLSTLQIPRRWLWCCWRTMAPDTRRWAHEKAVLYCRVLMHTDYIGHIARITYIYTTILAMYTYCKPACPSAFRETHHAAHHIGILSTIQS